MSNEQLLMQIGRLMGDTVREAVQESEERMKQYVHDVVYKVVHESEERTSKQIQELKERVDEMDYRLTTAIEDLRETVQQAMDDTERLALQIAATVEN